jgi:hypothetical protein
MASGRIAFMAACSGEDDVDCAKAAEHREINSAEFRRQSFTRISWSVENGIDDTTISRFAAATTIGS